MGGRKWQDKMTREMQRAFDIQKRKPRLGHFIPTLADVPEPHCACTCPGPTLPHSHLHARTSCLHPHTPAAHLPSVDCPATPDLPPHQQEWLWCSQLVPFSLLPLSAREKSGPFKSIALCLFQGTTVGLRYLHPHASLYILHDWRTLITQNVYGEAIQLQV